MNLWRKMWEVIDELDKRYARLRTRDAKGKALRLGVQVLFALLFLVGYLGIAYEIMLIFSLDKRASATLAAIVFVCVVIVVEIKGKKRL